MIYHNISEVIYKVMYGMLTLIPTLIHESVTWRITHDIILLFYRRTMKRMDRTTKAQRMMLGED